MTLDPWCPSNFKGRSEFELLEEVLSNFPDGVLVVDQQWHMVYFNKRFVEMWGIPREIQEKRDDRESIKSVLDKLEEPQEFLEKVEYLQANPGLCSWDELKLKDGRVYERFTTPLTGRDGHYIGRVWYFRDITPRVMLAQKHMALMEYVQGLEKFESLRTFAGSLSHHINNLLFGITGYLDLAELALKSENGHALKKHLENAASSARKAVAFGRKLAYYLGPHDLVYSRLEVNRLLQDMLSRALTRAPENVRILFTPAPSPLWIMGDRLLLEECMDNILQNSLEALNGDGEVEIQCKKNECDDPNGCPHITPPICLDSNRYECVSIAIKDNGQGLEPSFHKKVFDPFFSTKEFGRGLGLSMVMGIMKAHGGSVQFASEPGRGTSVTLFFPIRTLGGTQ